MIRLFYLWVLMIIQFLESFFCLTSDEKFQEEIDLSDVKVLSQNNIFQPTKKIFITKPFKVWELVVINYDEDLVMKCADDHLILVKEFDSPTAYWKKVKDLNKGELVKTFNGWGEVKSYKELNYSTPMFDLEVDHDSHSYYTNNILSHNTTTAAIFVSWYLIFNYDKRAIYISKTFTDAKEVLNKTKNIIKNLPFYMKPGIVAMNEHKLSLDNGCTITALPTTKSSGVGNTLNLLYIDEFAHIPQGFVSDFYENAIPTLTQDPNSKLIITSTPKGYNLFYTIWKAATTNINDKGIGENGFKSRKVDWWEVPGRDKEWKEAEIKRLGSLEAFKEQHGNQFLTSARLLLEEDSIKKLKDIQTRYVQRELEALETYNVDYPITFHPDFDIDSIGETNDVFLFTVDVGEGTGEDFSTIVAFKLELLSTEELKEMGDYKSIYDVFKLKQVMKFEHNKLDPGTFAKLAYVIFMDIFNSETSKVTIDWSAHGQAFYTALTLVFPERNNIYEELFVKYFHKINDKTAKIGLRLKNRETKDRWALNLREGCKKNRVDINEYDTIEQLSFFGKSDKKGYHGQTGNDDLVVNCILAASILGTVEWMELVDSYVDTLSADEIENIENMIERKLEFYDEQSDEGFIDLFSEEEGAREKYFDD